MVEQGCGWPSGVAAGVNVCIPKPGGEAFAPLSVRVIPATATLYRSWARARLALPPWTVGRRRGVGPT
eukprot:7434317-Alexandrium_andersonii.AAC.1